MAVQEIIRLAGLLGLMYLSELHLHVTFFFLLPSFSCRFSSFRDFTDDGKSIRGPYHNDSTCVHSPRNSENI
ncbi:hypothetical protein NEOLEDRAFT_767726 [Neolentinus lepideus HHB14362 ss-1]|uniref:Uncharacterized protein n=1 Tax=Neolentinus lepideus HHB14362 ss-1 TaxID=1314782 RepID=A0A165UT28_9AGAM|nr:hypothetical protein NEOLEDRAFT_767726 [Neolentinus lepideus HHB14362 ss-1]